MSVLYVLRVKKVAEWQMWSKCCALTELAVQLHQWLQNNVIAFHEPAVSAAPLFIPVWSST